MNKQRIDIWFKNDLFRAFPDVQVDTVERRSNGTIYFRFGNDHEAIIYESAINCMEIMYQEESTESHN